MRRLYPGKSVSCVSTLDKSRLEERIASRFYGRSLPPAANTVLRRLRNAEFVVVPDDVPRDLITMNCTIQLVDPILCEEWKLTLVYPEEHDPDRNKWSIFSPVGAELFGLRRYDAVDVKRDDLPLAGWVIADIPFQPEASGKSL